MATGKTDNKTVKVTLVRSTNGRLKSHKACVRGLAPRRAPHAGGGGYSLHPRHDHNGVVHGARRGGVTPMRM